MVSPKPTPLWLHVTRIATLVVVAAGVAWVVASVQRRANRALEARSLVVDDLPPREEPGADMTNGQPDFAEIEPEIVLVTPPGIRLTPDRSPAPVVSVSSAMDLSVAPDLKLDLDPDISVLFPVMPQPQFGDPYIGSSKSMVFEPSTFGPARRGKRHGKP